MKFLTVVPVGKSPYSNKNHGEFYGWDDNGQACGGNMKYVRVLRGAITRKG